MSTGLPDYFSRVFSEMLLTFLDLQDTPGSYEDEANKNVRVNEAESGLEFGGAYFDSGDDADKGEPGRKGRVWWASDSEILYFDDGYDWVEILRSEAVSRLASLIDHAHDSLSSVSSDQHHPHEHHADHENGGDHEISVEGLSGLLADPQTPIAQPKFSAHKNGTAQLCAQGDMIKLTFTTEEYDEGSTYDAANSKWVPGKVGKAHISARASWDTVVADTSLMITIFKNGGEIKRARLQPAGTTDGQGGVISCDVLVGAITDYFEIRVFQNTGLDQWVSGNASFTWFMGHMLV